MSNLALLPTKLIVLVLGLSSVVACKARNNSFALKGLTADKTATVIDYDRLFSKNSIAISQIVAYESSYYRQAGSSGVSQNGSVDEGVTAAFEMIKWLKDTAGEKLFKGRLVTMPLKRTTGEDPNSRDQNSGEIFEFPATAREVRLDRMYQYKAEVQGIKVKAGSTTRTINATINIVLGPSISSSAGMKMPDNFRKELARAFIQDDVVTYNGHIWSIESQANTSPWIPAEVDANTDRLTKEMKSIGKRISYGLIYMNACHGEKIENSMMDAMIGGNSDGTSEPILMSHKNYSNYGFFASHNASLLENIFNGQPLAKIILDMTSSIDPAWLRGNEVMAVPTYSQSRNGVASQKNYVPQYVRDPNWLKNNGVLPDPAKILQKYYIPAVINNVESVVIVAYDVIHRRKEAQRSSRMTGP